jgi:hypothetical protein
MKLVHDDLNRNVHNHVTLRNSGLEMFGQYVLYLSMFWNVEKM